MHDQLNIAEAKTRLSELIDRVEKGETLTIARNNRPIATLAPIRPANAEVLDRISALRERAAGPVRRKGESWRELAHEGHQH